MLLRLKSSLVHFVTLQNGDMEKFVCAGAYYVKTATAEQRNIHTQQSATNNDDNDTNDAMYVRFFLFSVLCKKTSGDFNKARKKRKKTEPRRAIWVTYTLQHIAGCRR